MTAGRPRDPEITDRVIHHALEQLRRAGYDALSIESVASASKVSKAAIYRRWRSKSDLAIGAILSIADAGECPDSGNVRDDLRSHVAQTSWSHERSSQDGVPDRSWSSLLSPDIASSFMRQVGSARRQNGRKIIARAVTRGELPGDTDADLILDALAGLAFMRLAVDQHPVTQREAGSIVEALCTAPPRLA